MDSHRFVFFLFAGEQRITINTPGRHRILAIVDALSSECSRTDFFVFDGYLPESNGGTDIESLQVECSMAPELHLLAFWSTMPEDRLVRLIRVLSAMSDVVNYPDANYHVRLHGVVRVDPGTANYIDESWYEEFYGDTYYGLYFGTDDKVDMMRVKGGGAFHVALVEDTCPKYAYDLGRDTILSTNMFALKRLLREQSPHWYQVHATQTRQESDADFKFLFGDTGRNAFHSVRLDMLWSPDKHDGRRTDNGVYVLSWKRVFIPVDVMEVFGAMMQSEWYRIELDVPEIHLTPGMLDPNPTSSQENILRVAFLGLTRIPLLAHLPTDSQWYKGLLELRHVKRFHVLKETKWGKVVPACSTVGEAAAILSSQDTTSEDCPASTSRGPLQPHGNRRRRQRRRAIHNMGRQSPRHHAGAHTA
ncbi:unnamed protein product [Phytophthora lilii]|uniref:Unnamed protein product n=1 Tax=Phytophthora lilii TaxID=2077276 RepID=A0A9W6TBF5_9STRA|nr:unnamed protein product [Phytophthora lilii]